MSDTVSLRNGTVITLAGFDNDQTAAGREVLVFIHGVGMSAAFWTPQLDAFAPHFACVTYDMLGHGGSNLPPENPCLADYTEQLHQLLDYLALDRVTVIGHSMGAFVAIEFALRHPERVARLVALNAVFRRTEAQRAAVMDRVWRLRDGDDYAGRIATLTRWFGPVVADHRSATRAHTPFLLL